MAAITDVLQTYVTETDLVIYPAVAATEIFQGIFIGENGLGDARPLVAADKFLGVNQYYVDNTTGAAGAEFLAVKKKCRIIYGVTGATAKTVNDRPAVYASDDNTLTLTLTGNSIVGSVIRWISGSTCEIQIEA